MSIDKSMINPGPMGWGLENEDIKEVQGKEKVYGEILQEQKPERLVRRAPKTPNIKLLGELNKLMAEDGIEGGFSCRYIEKAVFKKFLPWLKQLIGSCHPAGTLIRMADGSSKPIEEIQLRDKVLTAEGNTHEVSHVMIRKEEEKIYHIKAAGLPPLIVTKEHPLLTERGYVKAEDITVTDRLWIPIYNVDNSNILVTYNHLQYVNKNTSKSIKKLSSVASRSVFTNDGSRQSIRVYRTCPDVIELTEDFGWLIGMFLAEGSTDGNKIVFTLNANEEHTHGARILNIFKTLFNIEAYGRVIKEKNTYKISINSVVWSSLFKSLCSTGSGNKRIHADLLCGPKDFKYGLWNGWIDGDGYNGRGRICGRTISKKLAFDMYNIAMFLDYKPTMIVSYPKISHGVKTRQPVYTISITKSGKTLSREYKRGGCWSDIRSIKVKPYNGYVYNLEVLEDNSYVADGIGVHNCVASGAMRAITRRTLLESFLLGEPEEIFGTSLVGINNVAPFAPYHYRAGRKKGGINGNMDGSFCNAQIEGLLDFGILPCSTLGLVSDAFPEPQNTRTYRQWGANDKLLNEFAEYGRVFRLLESEPIKDYESCVTALREHFKPQMICSDWAFKPKSQHPTWKLANGDPVWIYTRDRRSSWAHNMTIDGSVTHRNNDFSLIDNSWGNDAHKNGSFFIIEAEEMERWIKDAEIMTIGDIDLKDNPSPA